MFILFPDEAMINVNALVIMQEPEWGTFGFNDIAIDNHNGLELWHLIYALGEIKKDYALGEFDYVNINDVFDYAIKAKNGEI